MIPDQEIIADTADPDNQKINPHINDLLCVTSTAFFIFLAASARTRIVSSDLLVFADRTGLFRSRGICFSCSRQKSHPTAEVHTASLLLHPPCFCKDAPLSNARLTTVSSSVIVSIGLAIFRLSLMPSKNPTIVNTS